LLKTLEYLGRIQPGSHKIDTPVGTVETRLNDDGSVTIKNVPSYRFAKDIQIEVAGYGPVTGDIAYGGNWFFLVGNNGPLIELQQLEELTRFSVAIRKALRSNNITGAAGAEIDHVELFAPSSTADSRNFVLCPGLEYDRSPCGTGTSAKLACLHADGNLAEGEVWRQESIIGSVFEGTVTVIGDKVIPSIRGSAFVTAEAEFIFDRSDPFRFGIA
jgi:4-hydroxyproline epimerase